MYGSSTTIAAAPLEPKVKCHGLYVQHLEKPVFWTANLFSELSSMYPKDFKFLSSNFIDKLYGDDKLRMIITEAGGSMESLFVGWKDEQSEFVDKSKVYFLY